MYNLEWYNLNANRRFPLIHEQDPIDITGKFTIPNNFIVDAKIMVNINFQHNFGISKILYTPEVLSITINDINEGIEALVGTLQNPIIEEPTTLIISGKDSFLGSYGKLIINSLENMPYGEFKFAAAVIEPCLVLKLGQGVTGINGITSGNVTLASKSNVVISKENNIIYIDTQDGLCACDSTSCLKTINGVEPVNRNINIVGRGCVTVEPIEGGILVGNSCEAACCGCDEINDFIDRINELQKRITILEKILISQ